MIKRMLLFCALALLAGCTASVEPGTQVAVNPLTYTDIPDNDIIRVGDDYYMVSTTMFYCPGAPIMHSRDLVHWRIVNYIYDVLEDDDIYNLRNEMAAYGKGQWASSATTTACITPCSWPMTSTRPTCTKPGTLKKGRGNATR